MRNFRLTSIFIVFLSSCGPSAEKNTSEPKKDSLIDKISKLPPFPPENMCEIIPDTFAGKYSKLPDSSLAPIFKEDWPMFYPEDVDDLEQKKEMKKVTINRYPSFKFSKVVALKQVAFKPDSSYFISKHELSDPEAKELIGLMNDHSNFRQGQIATCVCCYTPYAFYFYDTRGKIISSLGYFIDDHIGMPFYMKHFYSGYLTEKGIDRFRLFFKKLM